VTGFNARKWLIAFLLVTAVMLDSHAAGLKAPVAPGSCVNVGAAKVTSITQAAQAIVCNVSDRSLLVVGELHGTNETPDLVASIVKDALADRPVRLGLEMQRSEQPYMDAYVQSAGSAADKAAFLKTPFWKVQDGRSSTAMLRLIDTVRVLREHGARLNVVAMEPDYVDNAAITRAGGYQKFKESGMAQAIQRVMDKGDSRQLVVALMGNFHSRYDIDHPSSAKLGPSVVEQLARQRPYVVLPLAEATDAWYCQQDGCAVHSYTSDNTPKGRLPQFVVAVETPKGPTVVRLWLSKITAALPAGKVIAR
jgi:hypothetical protein